MTKTNEESSFRQACSVETSCMIAENITGTLIASTQPLGQVAIQAKHQSQRLLRRQGPILTSKYLKLWVLT
jgi:hypothetical protein